MVTATNVAIKRMGVTCSSPGCIPATLKSDSHVSVNDAMTRLVLAEDQARASNSDEGVMRGGHNPTPARCSISW